MSKNKCGIKSSTLDGMSGGIFMIGLGVLFLVDEISFWPWILVLIGITSLPSTIGRGDYSSGLQSFLWMVGLALLFSQPGLFFPGILILTGISIMIGALERPAKQKNKAKRGMHVQAGFGDELLDDGEYMFEENA